MAAPNWGGSAWSNRASFRPKTSGNCAWSSRYRQKLAQTLAGEKNRLHKILDDAGIKLGAVVADIGGVSPQAMIEGLIAGTPIEQLPDLAKGVMRSQRESLEAALDGDLSPRCERRLKPA